MKNKNRITLLAFILIEFFFFYKSGFQMSEIFFFIWFLIFMVFFAFRFVGGNSRLGGIGADSRYMAGKFVESMYVRGKQTKTMRDDFPLDLIFICLAVANFILSLVSYYLGG